MTGAAPDEVIIDEAAQWMALLQSGHASLEEQQAFGQWRSADPRRGEVFKAMGAGLAVLENDTLRRMPRDSLLQTLNAPSGRRRFVRNALSLVGVVSTAALVARITEVWPQPGVCSTGTGERRSLTLADGSALMLDARSKVLQRFDAERRLLQLLDGKLWIDVAKDHRRPFIVQTAQGQMRALGTRFLVEQEQGQTRLSMLHSQVQIRTLGGAARIVDAGEQVVFDADQVSTPAPTSGAESAWTQGRLEIRDQPLGRLIDALRDYRRGIIRVSPAAEALHLSGIFPLDDTDRALQLLARSLPVAINYHSPYWVSIDIR